MDVVAARLGATAAIGVANELGTCHTRWVRRPALVSLGSRVHTIPEPLATSIAAARATTCTGA
ncbi:MAG TPA: hypothetical protein VMV92_09360 [Streptosporangiaceae bacterium]|nr:hypothetical protein [Streptosporangiaceae bacterium]